MAKHILRVPFGKDGSMQSWVSSYSKEVEFRDNYEFNETMIIDNMSRGRSAANFGLIDSAGLTYNMFMSDMLDLVQKSTIVKGVVVGKWTFCKRGSNYGVKYIGGEE